MPHFPGNPTEMYFFGTQLSTCLLGVTLATIFANQFIIPILYNLKMYSIHEVINNDFVLIRRSTVET